MAATLTDSGELTHLSFDIEKVESTPDGDLMCYGRATDGGIDHDQQIVDPGFSSKAIRDWLATGGNIRVQHNAQRDPAGVGLEVNTDENGATWLKGLVIEPVAKKLLAAGALRAYSVGIARPTIIRDSVAKGGRITDGQIVEISLVDRPANARCGVTLVKSTDDGTPEYVGKVFGADDAIAKALGEPEAVKGGDGASAADEMVNVDLPATMSLSVSPADLAKMNTLSRQHAVGQHYDDLAVKAVIEAEAAVYKRDIDTAARRRLAADGKALPNLSYPVENAGDLQNAATLARSGHGDVAAARRLIARRAKELGVANPLDDDDKVKKSGDEERLTGMLRAAGQFAGAVDRAQDQAGAQKAVDDLAEALKEADPDLTKSCSKCSGGDCDGSSCPCGTCGDGKCCVPAQKSAGTPKTVKKAKKPKKLPPWLNKPSGDDDGGKEPSGGSGSCKSAHAWEITDPEAGTVECSKCHTSPAEAAGVTASPMDPAPVGELMESNAPASAKGATPQSAGGVKDAPAMSPVPAHREPDGAQTEAFEKDSGMSDGDNEAPTRLEAPTLKASPEVLALLRFKSAGIDPELGRLHDLTCPAYHPDEVAKYHPFAELPSLIDEAHWQRKALDAACGPLEHAIAMQELTGAAFALKAASDADVNDWRLEAHKAFRDANPGPGTYPSPGAVSPRKYCRPLITDGRSATSAGHSGPNTSPVVATSAPNASSFDRPPLSAGQESPSPSFMKWDSGQYPDRQGVPVQLSYAHLEKDKQRMALVQMHDHLSRQFPEVCPLDNVDLSGRADRPLRGVQPENRPVPATAGIGKAEDVPAVTKSAPSPAPVAAFKAEPEQGADLFADADVYKGFKKMRKKLGKKVLAGEMTVDEARTKMGRQFAQKGSSDEDGTAQKSAALEPYDIPGFVPPPPMPLSTVLPSAVQKTATPAVLPAPVAASFGPADIEAAVTRAVGPLLEKIQQQDETYTSKLAETQRVIDAIADQPDPSTAAFSGVAFHPVRKTARPAGVTDIAEAAARARRATERELENLYESASDPFAREGFYAALNKVRGGGSTP